MRLTRTQKCIVLSAGMWSFYEGLTVGFLPAFLIFLGASNVMIGILGALPYVSVLLSQIPGAKIIEFLSRKYVYILFSFVSRSFWLLIISVPLFTKYFSMQQIIILILLVYLFIKLSELLTDPAYKSMVADSVEEEKRGEFFAKRFSTEGFFAVIAFILGGLYLKIFNHGILGFVTLFAVGTLIGFYSIYIFNRVKEPEYRDHLHHTLKEFFTIKGEFGKYLMFVLYFYFGFMVVSPFFTVYMLRNLEINYAYFGFLTALSTFITVLTQNKIGRICDKYGDKKVAMLTVFGTSFVPLIYFFITKQNLWMLVPAQIISGFVWGGASLALFNLLVDFTEKQKRAFQIAEFNFFTAFPLIVSPIIGGYIADNATFYISGIPLLFLIGFVLRASSVLFLNKVKEPRVKNHYKLTEVFRQLLSFHIAEGFLHMAKTIVKRIK